MSGAPVRIKPRTRMLLRFRVAHARGSARMPCPPAVELAGYRPHHVSDFLRAVLLVRENLPSHCCRRAEEGEPYLTSASDANGARANVANGATAHRQSLPSWSRERSIRQPRSAHMCRYGSQTRQGPALQPPSREPGRGRQSSIERELTSWRHHALLNVHNVKPAVARA